MSWITLVSPRQADFPPQGDQFSPCSQLLVQLLSFDFNFILFFTYFFVIVTCVTRRPDSFPRWLSGMESACQSRRRGFDPSAWKMPWRRKWQLTSVSLPGKSHGQSLAGYSPRGLQRVRQDWAHTCTVLPFKTSHMDGPRRVHTEWSNSDRETQISCDRRYTWDLR